jgi:RHS repeat-associated protein
LNSISTTHSTICGLSPCFPSYRYTGKERDNESNNDYFPARYYNSSMGRWLSPDWSAKAEPVPYAKLDNPQSLNLYAYVLNNPMTQFDPDGHWNCTGQNAFGSACQSMAAIHAANGQVLNNAGQLVAGKMNTVTLNLGGIHVSVQYKVYTVTEGAYKGKGAMDITATAQDCDKCRWAQLVNSYDGNGTHKDGGNGNSPLYPATEKWPNLYDTPGGQDRFTGTAMVGYLDTRMRSFSVLGAFTYGFTSNGPHGASMAPNPTAVSPIEPTKILQADSPGWVVQ